MRMVHACTLHAPNILGMPMTRKRSGTAAKREVNVSVRRDLLAAARAANINLSATLERVLLESLKHAEREQWLNDNREAIAAHNDFMSKHGVFSDGLRSFGRVINHEIPNSV
jgi:antitoxin CcdA